MKQTNGIELSKRNFKSGELKDLVMTALGISILVGGTIITPNFPIVMGTILKLLEKSDDKPIAKKKVVRILSALEKQEIIDLQRKGDNVYVLINDHGIKAIRKYSIRELFRLKEKKVSRPTEWGLVMFDVPEIQRNKRRYLRRFLLWLGFYPYQKSVYAYPGNCQTEVELLKDMIIGGKYIRYIHASQIDGEEDLIRFFSSRKKVID